MLSVVGDEGERSTDVHGTFVVVCNTARYLDRR